MVKTIETFIEFKEYIKDMTFNEILGTAKCCMGEMELHSDVDDFNFNEIKCCVGYKGVRFVIELCFNNKGKYIRVCQFSKDGANTRTFASSQMVVVEGNEIDWADSAVYALNLSTKEFENCSGIKSYFFLSEKSVSARESNELDNTAHYALYRIGTMEKLGWVIVGECI